MWPIPLRDSRLRHFLAVLAVTAGPILAGCAASPGTQSLPANAVDEPSAADAPAPAVPTVASKVEINFIDLNSFDKSLEAALSAGATEIEVKLSPPMSPNAISPRLGRWINTVQESGGDVKVDSDSRTRSTSLIISLLDAAIGAWRDIRTKALVKDVDAEMVVRGNQIETVRFTRSPAP